MNAINILLEVSVYSSLIFACILLFKRLFKNKLSPHLHYGIWALLLLRLLVPVTLESDFRYFRLPQMEMQQYLVLTDSGPRNQSVAKNGENMEHPASDQNVSASSTEGTIISTAEIQNQSHAQLATNATAPTAPPAQPLSLTDWLLILWLTGAGVICLWFCLSYRQFQRRMRVSSTPCPEGLSGLLEQVKRELGIKRRIMLSCHKGLSTPALRFPATILMPANLPMSLEQVKMALRHELTHYKRGDHLVSTLMMGLLTVYWFNPLVWIAFRKIRDDMEAVCDNEVVKAMGSDDRSTYASTLLFLFSMPKKEKMVLGMAPSGTKKMAEKRIRGVFTVQKSRWLARLTAMLLIPTLLTACFTTVPKPSNPMETTSDKLVVYMNPNPYRTLAMQSVIAVFNSMYPDVEVDVREFGSYEDPNNYQNYKAALQTDFMTGTGPDIVLLSGELDPYKAMEAGVFADLEPYLHNDVGDGSLNLSDYNQSVLEAGVYKGKRYLMPISYMFPGVIATEESLRINSLPLDGEMTFDEYLAALKNFAEANDTTPFTQQHERLHSFLNWSGLELIDNANRRANPNAIRSEAFRKIVDTYKSYYAYDYVENNYLNDDADELARQERLFTPDYSAQPVDYFLNYSMIFHESTPVVSEIKSVDGKVVAQVQDYAVIRASSKNKANAWRFIKILLSGQYQVSDDMCYDFPVLKDALKKRFEEYASDSTSITATRYNNGEPIGWEAFAPLDTFDSFFSLVDKVDGAVLDRPQTHDFLWDSLLPYLDGVKDYETCLAEFENRLGLYASE